MTFLWGTVILIGSHRDGKFHLLSWLVSQAGNWLFFLQIQKAFSSYYFFLKAVMKLHGSRFCPLLQICGQSFCTIACIKTWVSFKIVEIKQVLSILWIVLRSSSSDSGGETLKLYKGSSVLQQVQWMKKKSSFRYYQQETCEPELLPTVFVQV